MRYVKISEQLMGQILAVLEQQKAGRVYQLLKQIEVLEYEGEQAVAPKPAEAKAKENTVPLN